jgi:hypothetical protein
MGAAWGDWRHVEPHALRRFGGCHERIVHVFGNQTAPRWVRFGTVCVPGDLLGLSAFATA